MEKVVVLGSEVAKKLFGEKEAIGKNLRLKNNSFKVIGVMEKRA